LLPVIVMAMAEDKGTSTPKQVKEPTRRVHIPRVVIVVLLTALIASSIAVVLFAGVGIDNPAALWGTRAVAVLVVIGALWCLIRIGYEYQWTGLGEAELPKQENVEFRPKKTLWDWLQLLIIPIVLSFITVAFSWQQEARQQQIESQRAEQAQKIENQRAEAERTIQQQNAQDEALQAYLDQMSALLLEKDLRCFERR
jgi:hypothetical protein